MHFAAFAHVEESIKSPDVYYRNNVLGSLSLLEAMREHGPDLIVFSSSCATYGLPIQVPMNEDHPQNPINPYGAGKLMAERMLQDFEAAYGLRWMSLRYFNAAGADPEGETGELQWPRDPCHPIGHIFGTRRIPAFRLYAPIIQRPTVRIRDYIHVTDLASAHLECLLRLSRGGRSMAVNLGTGSGTSVLEILKAVERVGHRPVPIMHCQRRPGDPHTLVADGHRARAVLDWQPRYLSIDDVRCYSMELAPLARPDFQKPAVDYIMRHFARKLQCPWWMRRVYRVAGTRGTHHSLNSATQGAMWCR